VKYEIDCLVTFKALGLPTKWIVECKDWGSRVPQEVAASLRQRVTDTGADKGILVCPSGFQSGTLRQAEISSLVPITPDELENTLWAHFKEFVTLASLKQIRELGDQIISYRIRLEDYLYAYEKIKDIQAEYRVYNALGLWSCVLTATASHLEEWQAGRASLGPPAVVPRLKDGAGELRPKTDFRDDQDMLEHVCKLISGVRRRILRTTPLVESLPPCPRSPMWPEPLKGPRYFPTLPKQK
jgi:hypothetical protein